ncbi:MAG: hypothetical protein U1C97_01350 [Candidatus Gracilibacteria bacterium]|nr:hypothetical protein [bacterium]MDZ4216948.1 hypothetical protein [Candidatus Gracilibacteria bacterium]
MTTPDSEYPPLQFDWKRILPGEVRNIDGEIIPRNIVERKMKGAVNLDTFLSAYRSLLITVFQGKSSDKSDDELDAFIRDAFSQNE